MNQAEYLSGIALNQAHEHNNGFVKPDDGVIVTTEYVFQYAVFFTKWILF